GHNMPEADYPTAGQHATAEEVYRLAGVGPDDIDVAEIYDHFTPLVLMGLEDFGFCKPGESGPFVADGNIRPEGPLPVNTHGGNPGGGVPAGGDTGARGSAPAAGDRRKPDRRSRGRAGGRGCGPDAVRLDDPEEVTP